MKKVINGKEIVFYDDNNNAIMYMDYPHDECVWGFYSDAVITITPDMELYSFIDYLMKQSYVFGNSLLKSYKDDNYLKWYSDCYYNPDDEMSVNSVSCLNIKREGNSFKIWCVKPLFDIYPNRTRFYAIAFSPCGNGVYSYNDETGLSLQDDFVINVYRKLKMPINKGYSPKM